MEEKERIAPGSWVRIMSISGLGEKHFLVGYREDGTPVVENKEGFYSTHYAIIPWVEKRVFDFCLVKSKYGGYTLKFEIDNRDTVVARGKITEGDGLLEDEDK